MDVIKLRFFAIILYLFYVSTQFLACSENKSVSSVFPENEGFQKTECEKKSIASDYIVQWNDGRLTREHFSDDQSIIENFIKPNLHLLKHVEHNKRINIDSGSFIVKKESKDDDESLYYWGQKVVEAQAVWDLGIDGDGVVIGVVDAAVDYRHPQIAPQLLENRIEIEGKDGYDDDNNGYIDDYFGWDFTTNKNEPVFNATKFNFHGTHIAGIMVANKMFGLAEGLAPEAKIIPANIMDAEGNGSLWAAISAIKYVSDRGAKIINASWGGKGCSRTLKETIENLAAKNILFVSASGNEGIDLDTTPIYPSAFNFINQINVAATDEWGHLQDFSNTSFELVHIGAPGTNILSTVPGGYAFAKGTSMAAPFVSGAAALLWSHYPSAHFQQIKSSLLQSVDLYDYRVQSRGRLNVRKALDVFNKTLK